MRTKEYKSENSALQSQWNTYLFPNILESNPNKGITRDSRFRVYKMRVGFVANIKASRDTHLCDKLITSLISSTKDQTCLSWATSLAWVETTALRMPSKTREEVDKTSIRESSTQVHKLPRVDGHLAVPTMAQKMLLTTLVGESRISELPSSTLVVGSIKNLSL
ncbi:hypothetical protein VNO80_10706 [Phaseolus coccineus]|uniref:Uncharacterized protein n=1 Tax=Phaseolus coccineus TaxID=3886 RepID=A0AAN9NF17_PHACN